MLESPTQPEEQRLGEEREIAKVHELFQGWAIGLWRDARWSGVGTDVRDHIERFRANEDSFAGWTARGSYGNSQDRNTLLVIRIGLIEVLRDANLVMERYCSHVIRIVRHEDCSEVLVDGASPAERAIHSGATADLL